MALGIRDKSKSTLTGYILLECMITMIALGVLIHLGANQLITMSKTINRQLTMIDKMQATLNQIQKKINQQAINMNEELNILLCSETINQRKISYVCTE